MSRHQSPDRKRRVADSASGSVPAESRTIWERLASLFVPKKGRKLRTNRYMFHTSLFVVAIFLGLVGYIVKFTIVDAPDVINSPYNKRTAALSEKERLLPNLPVIVWIATNPALSRFLRIFSNAALMIRRSKNSWNFSTLAPRRLRFAPSFRGSGKTCAVIWMCRLSLIV